MKKIKLKDLKLDSKSVLSKEQMKKVAGGLKYCGDGAPCGIGECCDGFYCRKMPSPYCGGV